MDADLTFAEDVEVCPKCGSTIFWENWIGDDEDAELMNFDCVNCGAIYYGRDWYERHHRKPNADDEIPY